ncbi:hypothetical protein [Streptomyces sp. NPDC012510]|uniref:hypothetical protein n=1 Tax=Streptomyces sp. NPDC012510 TaxID=3364838 RepID=UPI0036E780B0
MKRRPNIDHKAVAAACRNQPGIWQPVAEYNSSQSAAGAAGYIRDATTKKTTHLSPYAPAGAYEARHALTEYGARVEARFVGGSDDTAWADALAGLNGSSR